MRNNLVHQSIPNNTEEIPITAHIFEGHLYLKENNKWSWRLFRFDGSSLTCLSSKKNKLPPHTLLDPPSPSMMDNRPTSFLTSSTSNSLTSPLLATPKNRTVRLTNDLSNNNNNDDPPAIASYYQLPKWTIEMINISSISILKPTTKSTIKSFKHPFTSANKLKSFSIRTYDGNCYIMKAHKQHDLEKWIFVLAKMWKFSQAARQLYYHHHQPLVVSPRPQSLVLPYHNTTPMLSGSNHTEEYVVHQTPPQNDSRRRDMITTEQQHLSNEKVLWIEEWIKSLAELAACGDSTSELNYNSVYETLKEEHDNHTTSSSFRRNSSRLQQRPSLLRKSHTTTSIKDPPMKQEHDFEDKKRFENYLTTDNFNINFFQDANTVYTDEISANNNHHYQLLKYHTSTRGQQIKLVDNNNALLPLPTTITNNNIEIMYDSTSPLENFKISYSEIRQQQIDENVCLADVQKFLKNLNINNNNKAARYSLQQQPLPTTQSSTISNKIWYRNSWTPNNATTTFT